MKQLIEEAKRMKLHGFYLDIFDDFGIMLDNKHLRCSKIANGYMIQLAEFRNSGVFNDVIYEVVIPDASKAVDKLSEIITSLKDGKAEFLRNLSETARREHEEKKELERIANKLRLDGFSIDSSDRYSLTFGKYYISVRVDLAYTDKYVVSISQFDYEREVEYFSNIDDVRSALIGWVSYLLHEDYQDSVY